MAGERINVSKEVGGKLIVQSVAADKLAAAQDAGWDIAAPEQTEQYKYEREVMNRPGAQFEAGFEGFSRAVTLGASDAVLAAIVEDEERKAMGVRSETDAAGTGEALGTAATLLSATGALRALGGRAAAAEGSALLRAGGRATQLTDTALAHTPLGLVARGAAKVGEAVEGKIIGDATAGVARKALARGAGLGAEGALEGAAVGVGQEVSEAALGDTELTAQKLLAGAGRGALFGGLTGAAIGAPLGAAGGIIGAPKALAGRAARQAGEALDAAKATTSGHVAPEIAQSLGDKAIDLYSAVASRVSGKPKAEIQFGIRNRDARADYWKLDELKRASTERAATSLDEMKSLRRLEKRIASGDFASEGLSKSIRRDAGATELQSARAAALVEEMAQESAVKPIANGAEVKRLLGAARGELAAAAKARDPGVASHRALETLRRGLDDLRSRARTGADTPALSQLHEWADINTRRADALLNDTETWGTAGAQRAQRAGALDAVRKTKRDFDGRFYQIRANDLADPTKIGAHFDRIADASKDYSHVQSIRHLDDRLRLYDVLEQSGDLPADLADELAKARAVTTKLKADFSEMGERIGGANRVASLYAEDAFTRMMGGTPATVLGSLTGGPGGAAAGFAIDALRNPGALIQRLGAIESLADRVRRVDAKIGNSVRAFVRQETSPALRSQPERQARKSIRTSSAVAAAAIYGDAKQRNRQVSKRVDAVRAYQQDPVPSTDAFVRRAMRGVSDYAPETAMGIAKTHARAMQFLAAKLPPVPRSQLSALQPSLADHVLAPSQVNKLAKYMRTIEEPVTILEDMRTGMLSPEAVEAIRAVYPDLWSSMRNVAITEVATAKKPLSHTAVVRLSLLFDFAGAPTLTPEFQARHNQLMEQRAQFEAQQTLPPSARKAPNPAPTTLTLSQRLSVM